MRKLLKDLIELTLKSWYMRQYTSWIHFKYQLNEVEKIKPLLDAMHRKLFGFGLDD